jgi:hypothetical protein
VLGTQPEFVLPERLPEELTVTTPEGFAYYALHPMRYADALKEIGTIADAVVIGIRSIGTTLSAVAGAALRKSGETVKRFTVRPEGHPFDRILRWSYKQLALVREASRADAMFVIVDEGPGLSGSSFLSVAEALCDAGVPAGRIVLMPSYSPVTSRLRARDAVRRWSKFRCSPIGDGWRPQGEWMGGGRWRERFIEKKECWPGAWTTMERAKFLSLENQVLWKFEGLGPYGETSRMHARALAESGWSAPVTGVESGFIGYRLLNARRAAPRELDSERIQRIAAYCAFRAVDFACDVTKSEHDDLTAMVKVNFEREFQCSIPSLFSQLEVLRPTLCDAKMSPHEWLQSGGGRLLKLDATAHGDDHFFPGPCDIAWDLAGAIVEWNMDHRAKTLLLREYLKASGDDAAARIDAYVMAYTVFRFAWCKMAAAGMQGTDDEQRLLREYRKYSELAQRRSSVSTMR